MSLQTMLVPFSASGQDNGGPKLDVPAEAVNPGEAVHIYLWGRDAAALDGYVLSQGATPLGAGQLMEFPGQTTAPIMELIGTATGKAFDWPVLSLASVTALGALYQVDGNAVAVVALPGEDVTRHFRLSGNLLLPAADAPLLTGSVTATARRAPYCRVWSWTAPASIRPGEPSGLCPEDFEERDAEDFWFFLLRYGALQQDFSLSLSIPGRTGSDLPCRWATSLRDILYTDANRLRGLYRACNFDDAPVDTFEDAWADDSGYGNSLGVLEGYAYVGGRIKRPLDMTCLRLESYEQELHPDDPAQYVGHYVAGWDDMPALQGYESGERTYFFVFNYGPRRSGEGFGIFLAGLGVGLSPVTGQSYLAVDGLSGRLHETALAGNAFTGGLGVLAVRFACGGGLEARLNGAALAAGSVAAGELPLEADMGINAVPSDSPLDLYALIACDARMNDADFLAVETALLRYYGLAVSGGCGYAEIFEDFLAVPSRGLSMCIRACAGQAAESDGSVPTLADESGNGWDLHTESQDHSLPAQLVQDERPLLRFSARQVLDVYYWGEAAYNSGEAAGKLTGQTCVWVCRLVQDAAPTYTGSARVLWQIGNAYVVLHPSGDSEIWDNLYPPSGSFTFTAGLADLAVLSVRVAGDGTVTARLNGASVLSGQFVSPVNEENLLGGVISVECPGGALHFDLAEYLWFQSALSDDDLAYLEGTLMAHYSITA